MYSVFLSQLFPYSCTLCISEQKDTSFRHLSVVIWPATNSLDAVTHRHTPKYTWKETLTNSNTSSQLFNLQNYNLQLKTVVTFTHIFMLQAHRNTRGYLAFLSCVLLSVFLSVCLVFAAVLYCTVYSALFGWVELHAGQSSPSCLFESLVTIQRSAERNCSSHVYSTQLFHSDKLAPSLPDSLLLLSLSLSHALTTIYTPFHSSYRT